MSTFPTPQASKHPRVFSPHLCLVLLMEEPQASRWRPRRQPEGSSHMRQPSKLGEAALASLRPDMSHCWLPHLKLKPNQPGLCQFSCAECRGAALCSEVRAGVWVLDYVPFLPFSSAQQRRRGLTYRMVACGFFIDASNMVNAQMPPASFSE